MKKNNFNINKQNYDFLNNKIANITSENIGECKNFIEDLKKKNIDINNMNNKQSLKLLKESGFFNFDFLENKSYHKINIPIEEIKNTFKIIGGNSEILNVNELKKKINIINPKFPINEINNLTNGKTEIRSSELFELLKDNDLENFNPLEEVFKILDVKNENKLDLNYLNSILKNLKLCDLDEKDKEILFKCLDFDGDNEITLDDFKTLNEKLKNE